MSKIGVMTWVACCKWRDVEESVMKSSAVDDVELIRVRVRVVTMLFRCQSTVYIGVNSFALSKLFSSGEQTVSNQCGVVIHLESVAPRKLIRAVDCCEH